jgi:hypothetical protein
MSGPAFDLTEEQIVAALAVQATAAGAAALLSSWNDRTRHCADLLDAYARQRARVSWGALVCAPPQAQYAIQEIL